MHAEQSLRLVAGRALRRRDLLLLRLVEVRGDRRLQRGEKGEDALRELLAVARIVGARRREGEGPPSLDERVEADEVHGLLEALAELRIDACAQIGWLVRVAAQRGTEKRVGRHDLTLAMLRS